MQFISCIILFAHADFVSMEPALFYMAMLVLVTPAMPIFLDPFYDFWCPFLFVHSESQSTKIGGIPALPTLLYWIEEKLQLELKGCLGNVKFVICIG